MKKIFLYSLITITLLTLTSFFNNFVPKPSILEVSGYIKKKENKISGATVSLYQNNVMVSKLITKKNGRFKFILFSDNEYMVSVNSVGSMDERIYINTKTNADLDDKYYFEFIVDLIDANKYKNVDASNLDFPTAIVRYDSSEDEYVHDKGYSQKVKNDLKKMNEQLKTIK